MRKCIFLFVALACLVMANKTHAGAGAIIDSLMFRKSINAVHLDGTTWLDVSHSWNAPNWGTTFFRSWWERSDAQTGDAVIFAVSDNTGDILQILEIPSADQGSDQLYISVTEVIGSGDYNTINCWLPGSGGILPRNGKWTLVQVAIDTTALTCQYAVQQGAWFEAGQMIFSGAPGNIPWRTATKWTVGGNWAEPSAGGYPHPVLDYAEAYMDLKFSWLLTDGVASLLFATEGGFARNLDWQQGLPPHIRDCAEPLAGQFPEMCERGDTNNIVNGFEVTPHAPGYVMTVHGTLQIAPSGPCLVRGIGDGCSGP